MPKKTENQRKLLFVSTLGEVAENCGVSLDTVKRWRAEGMPGSPKKYVIRDILVWARGEGPWRQHAKQQPIDVDPLLGDDSDSDALERYRLAKAKHAELDLEERRKELIERSKCRDALARWASLIRRMGEVLSKRHGVSAAKTVNLTLEECEVIAKGLLGDDSNT